MDEICLDISTSIITTSFENTNQNEKKYQKLFEKVNAQLVGSLSKQ